MMKPATMERKIRSLEEAIRSLHKALEEVQREQVYVARLAELSASHGLEAGRPASPPPVPAGHRDDAGGS